MSHVRGNMVGYLALLVALSGSAYAASELGRNEVLSKNIKNGQVKSKDLADNSVNGSKVRDGSLMAGDFAAGQLPRGADGANATKLFAYVRSDGDLRWGQGVTSAAFHGGGSPRYTVTFAQPLTHCVVVANQGVGTPTGPLPVTVTLNGAPSVLVFDSQPNVAQVEFRLDDLTNLTTSFMIAAFC